MDRRSFIKSLALVAAAATIEQAIPSPLRHIPVATPVDDGPWIPCDGRTLSRARYADLFQAIGTSYGGPPEDPTTFRIPDCRGRMQIIDEVHRGDEVTHAQYEVMQMIAARPDAGMPAGWINMVFVETVA